MLIKKILRCLIFWLFSWWFIIFNNLLIIPFSFIAWLFYENDEDKKFKDIYKHMSFLKIDFKEHLLKHGLMQYNKKE